MNDPLLITAGIVVIAGLAWWFLRLRGTIAVDQLDEVEYGSDLVTGGIADGAVLRLRSHGRAIELLLEMPAAQEWSRSLPPHRMGETGIA